ncbi:hypothetical protein V9T40_001419 [Parthenolecanium corni]|uniref:Uncharacterized protein n=1 Tax=Parthenolecanium corni TaxID=536013 RepID=A0AAN9TDG0_9HEMI
MRRSSSNGRFRNRLGQVVITFAQNDVECLTVFSISGCKSIAAWKTTDQRVQFHASIQPAMVEEMSNKSENTPLLCAVANSQ